MASGRPTYPRPITATRWSVVTIPPGGRFGTIGALAGEDSPARPFESPESCGVTREQAPVHLEEHGHLALPVVGFVGCPTGALAHRGKSSRRLRQYGSDRIRDRCGRRRIAQDADVGRLDDLRHPGQVRGNDWYARGDGLEQLLRRRVAVIERGRLDGHDH